MRGLAGDARGTGAVEFALVLPAFLMMIFLILDGGRVMFAKQALNELAAAGARCAALHPAGCATQAATQQWVADRGNRRSQLKLTAAMVTASLSTSCNGVSGMAQVTVTMPFPKGAMTLLPQSAVPANLTATSCFPASA